MFRDTSEELERLQAELLAQEPEEEQPEEPAEEEYEQYGEYEDTRPAQGPVVYQNYSNDYGKNLRNYASGYRAYNTDAADTDEAFIEDVRSGGKKRGSGCLVAIALFLGIVLAALLLLGFAYYRGYIR